MANLHQITSKEELPDRKLVVIRIFSLWGAKHYLDINGYKEGWFLNVNYGEKWLYVVDQSGYEGDTLRRIG